MSGATFIAVDLGAESGRVVAGTLDDHGLAIAPIYRFPNVSVRLPDGLHWDVLRLFAEILTGLRTAGLQHGRNLAGIGVDSWGVDYALLDANDRLLGNPTSYRDPRTDGIIEQASIHISHQELYARTGIAQLPFNTIYQLMAQAQSGDPALELARSLLMIPDLMHFWLSGEQCAEYTNATTTGALGIDNDWVRDLLDRLGVPAHILLKPDAAGTHIGFLRQAVQEECALDAVPVILPASHDTASAVVAVPASHASSGYFAFISCGTWSLLGLELDHPILTEEARLAGFTNEGGIGGSYRFLTNISGLWLVQECRRAWARHGTTWDYEDLIEQAGAAQSPRLIIDVDDPSFLHPEDMPAAIAAQLRAGNQQVPAEAPVLVRAVLESLALKYRLALRDAERLSGVTVHVIHMVGGGVRNRLLCQLTADACARMVAAGPAEGTALGNILVQAMSVGMVANLAEARYIARGASDVQHYQPRANDWWDDAYGRLLQIRHPAL